MTFFKKDKKSNGHLKERQEKASCDPLSLGNILTSTGTISHEQLLEALQYQLDNQDEMLGEILIKLGHLTKDAYETAIMKQRAMKNGFSRAERQMCFSIAKSRTDSVVRAHAEMHEAAVQLVRKLKVEEG